MKSKKWLVVAIFLGLATLIIATYSCNGGGGPTSPSSSIIGSWGGYWQNYNTYVTLTFKTDGQYEERRANMRCKLVGTYVLGTWSNGSSKITITQTGGFCGTFTEPVVLNWSYRIEGNVLWIMGDIRMERVEYPG